MSVLISDMYDKPVLVYYSLDCFIQVDDTVLCHLTNNFKVVWFYLYESMQANTMRYNPVKAQEYADKYGITLEIVDPKMRRRDPRNLFYYRKVAKRINSYNPDIVYSCDFLFWSFCRRSIKCNNKVFGIHDAKGHSLKFNIFNYILKRLSKSCRKSMDCFFTFSPNQHDLFKELYGKESYMVGMSIKNFGKSKIIPAEICSTIKLLFFGSIKLYKGLDLLINAVEELKRQGIGNLSLTIAGKGESWEECKELIKTPELYNLQVRFIDNDEIPDLMSSHHFIVLPYRDATQSGPLVAALNYCLPVVAPRFGCFTELFDDTTAILYKPGDLLSALKRVSEITPSEYSSLKDSLKKLRNLYSEEKIAQNYIEAFDHILNNNGKKNS